MIIYNLFPLLAGRFEQWHPHLERAAALGFDWVFVNPIQAPGYSGSLYSIRDYFRLNPLLLGQPDAADGGVAEFRPVAEAAARLKLRLMVDLVVSHCAFDSPLVKEHPAWFSWENGKVVHPSCKEGTKTVVWKDLAKIDHRHSRDAEALFQYLLRVVEFLIGLGFQGFRCDAAYQVPAAFWKRLIRETRRKHPGVVFLAETLGCSPSETLQTARAGFPYIFNSAKWWDYRSPWLLEQYDLTRGGAQSVTFPESHDTPRLAHEVDGQVEILKRQYLFSAVFSAGVMVPIGFEYGFRKALHVVKTRPEDWETPSIDLTGFIASVNRMKAQHPVFQEDGPLEMLPVSNPNLLLLWKGTSDARQEALILLNRDTQWHQTFQTDNLYQYVQAPGPLVDVSPEFPLDYLPTPYEYSLRPSQVIVLVTRPERG